MAERAELLRERGYRHPFPGPDDGENMIFVGVGADRHC